MNLFFIIILLNIFISSYLRENNLLIILKIATLTVPKKTFVLGHKSNNLCNSGVLRIYVGFVIKVWNLLEKNIRVKGIGMVLKVSCRTIVY